MHLDRVAKLGDFLELEVVLAENESLESGVVEAHEIMAKLGVEPRHLIEQAYVELLGGEGI